MKKSLVALAALAVVGAASAQSSVTLFGTLDAALERVTGDKASVTGMAPSALSSSRLGFRGVEDLGGGMIASFHLEAALGNDSGIGSSGTTTNNQSTNVAAGGLTFNRRSTVSLTAGFGEVRLGRDYTPTFWNYALYDAFGANSVGAALNNYTGAGAAATFVRASNSIGYFLPSTLGGIKGQFMYAMGENASNATAGTPAVSTKNNGNYVGGRLGYEAGPVDVAVSYGKTKYAALTNASAVLGSAAFASGNFTDTSFGGSYDLGVAKLMANYSIQKLNDVVTVGNNSQVKGWTLGATVPLGQSYIPLSVSQVKADNSSAKASKYAVGYVYNLSKRTALYGYVARVTNAGGSAQTAGSFSSGALGGAAVNANSSSTGFDFGLKHSF